MRRIRPSFLLRVVALAIGIGLFFVIVKTIDSIGWTVAAVSFVAAFWFVGLEGGVVPTLIERAAVKRAKKSGGPVRSLWFVDVDAKNARVSDQAAEDSRDNPTIR